MVSATIEAVLALLAGVLAGIKPLPGVQNLITAVEDAITALSAVQNDPVLKSQVDSLTITSL